MSSTAATTAAATLISFPVVTIFCREVLEAAIIIGEYRTIILRGSTGEGGSNSCLQPGIQTQDALREVTLSSLFATAFAFLVIAAIAIPLAVLSLSFDATTSKVIEGISKIVAGICLLQLSLKLPKFLGIYGSLKKKKKKSKNKKSSPEEGSLASVEMTDPQSSSDPDSTLNTDNGCNNNSMTTSEEEEDRCDLVDIDSFVEDVEVGRTNTSRDRDREEDDHQQDHNNNDYLTIRSIRFNVAWNIWREVAECGVFLIPFFLSGQGLQSIPLSALIGSVVGFLCGMGIYIANWRVKNKTGLAVFSVLLLSFLSAGLFTGGAHNLESAFGSTPQVWQLRGDFWNVHRLPMTILKPFGYNDSRTVLEMICFWFALGLSGLLHYRKYRLAPKPTASASGVEGQDDNGDDDDDTNEVNNDSLHSKSQMDTVLMGDSSLEGDPSIRYDAYSLDGDNVTIETDEEMPPGLRPMMINNPLRIMTTTTTTKTTTTTTTTSHTDRQSRPVVEPPSNVDDYKDVFLVEEVEI